MRIGITASSRRFIHSLLQCAQTTTGLIASALTDDATLLPIRLIASERDGHELGMPFGGPAVRDEAPDPPRSEVLPRQLTELAAEGAGPSTARWLAHRIILPGRCLTSADRSRFRYRVVPGAGTKDRLEHSNLELRQRPWNFGTQSQGVPRNRGRCRRAECRFAGRRSSAGIIVE